MVASILGEILVVGLLLRTFRALGWQPIRIARSALRLAIIALPTALLMLALREQMILLPLVAGLGSYFIAIMLGRVFGSDDWDLLYRLTAAIPGGTIVLRFWKRDVELTW